MKCAKWKRNLPPRKPKPPRWTRNAPLTFAALRCSRGKCRRVSGCLKCDKQRIDKFACATARATPLDVLTRRPDVRAAERQARAAAAKLASAKMDRLPRFDIQFAWNNGRIGLDNNLSSIAKSTGGLLSAGVTVPLFTAGRIRANIAAADARVKAAAAQYDNTLLTALSEVDSSYHCNAACLTNAPAPPMPPRKATAKPANHAACLSWAN